MSFTTIIQQLKGGANSGNHGHSGIPGHVGGSAGGRSSLAAVDYVGSLDADDKAAVKDYTFTEYKKLNKKLRSGDDLDSNQANLVSTLDKVINTAPDIKASKVYRAMQASPDALGMQVGKTYSDPAYLSTTHDAGYMYRLSGENELKTRLTIKVPKGTPGVYTEKISYKPKEKEVLLGRNTAMKITAIDVDEFGNRNVTAELL